MDVHVRLRPIIGEPLVGSADRLMIHIPRAEEIEAAKTKRGGWTRTQLAEWGVPEIRSALAPLARATCPLTKPLRKKDTTWTEPRYEAEVAYADMTDDGMIRHPSFKALLDASRNRPAHKIIVESVIGLRSGRV
jgi:hypothetical protein